MDRTSPEGSIQTHHTTKTVSERQATIQHISNMVLQQHGDSCAVQLLIRLNTKLAYAFSHGRHLRMIPVWCLREIEEIFEEKAIRRTLIKKKPSFSSSIKQEY